MFKQLLPALLFAALASQASALQAAEPAQKSGNKPIAPVKVEECLACHNTAIKTLHDRGKHKNVNCSTCHETSEEHKKAPSAKNRPTTRFDYASCSGCHADQHKDLMDPKYHYQWAEKGGNRSYAFLTDPQTGFNLDTQYRLPRFHVGIMNDLMANRSNGRFKYMDKKDQGKPFENVWESVEDTTPELGLKNDGDVVGIAWRPHKGREAAKVSYCALCKSTQSLQDWAFDMTLPNPKGYDMTSPLIPMAKKTNTSFNCNYCHDPHSAEPRVIIPPFIASVSGKHDPSNLYFKGLEAGDKAMTKVEVIDMGTRGIPRKIGILSRNDGNFQCGQCHNNMNRYGEFKKIADGKKVTHEEMDAANLAAYSTPFLSNPIDLWQFFIKDKGWYLGIDKKTGVYTLPGRHHAHIEIITSATHGKAGVSCTDCHFARKTDGTQEHNPSLPREKVAQTCMRSDCHGAGTKDNWTRPGQALYTLETIQQEYRIRARKMDLDAAPVQKILMDVKEGKTTLPAKELEALKDAYGKYLITRDFYFADYSEGLHDFRGFDKYSSIVIRELRNSLAQAQKALSKKNG